MDTLEKIFLGCAVVGGALFLVRLVLFFLGGHLDGDVDSSPDLPHDLPYDVPHDVAGHLEAMDQADASFRLISFQGIMGFLMMFGLVGLALKKTTSGSDAQALILSGAAGVAMMFAQAKLMFYLLRLQSIGNLDPRRAIGNTGTVYLTIPENDAGKVRIVVQNRLKVMDAVSRNKEKIPTGERVRVVDVTDGNVLVVEKADGREGG